VRVLSFSDPLWSFVMMFLAIMALAEQFLPFPKERDAIYEMSSCLAACIHGPICIRTSWLIVSQYYGRRLRTKRGADKSQFELQKEFHQAPHDPNMRFLLRWNCGFFIADGIYFLYHWNQLYFLHHLISVSIVLTALVVGHGGLFTIAGIFCGELTNPLLQVLGALRQVPLILTNAALADYLIAVDKRFIAPVFFILFSFCRFVMYPVFYLDYLSFYFRRLYTILPSSQRSKAANDKRAADEHASEHPDLANVALINETVEPHIPFLVRTVWAILPGVILYGSANHVLEHLEYLVLPDLGVLVGW
jgi:hypothetical protein